MCMRAEGLEVMRGNIRPLNPALRRGHTAHGEGVLSTKGYHGAMAPCLCLLVERQGAQNRRVEVNRWEGVGGRGRGRRRGMGWGWRGHTPGPGPRGRGVWCIQRGAGREHLNTAGEREGLRISYIHLYIEWCRQAPLREQSLLWNLVIHKHGNK